MVSALALVALAAFAPFQDPATSVVQGRVRSQQTGAPLSHTIVEIRGVALPLVALTDSTGFYRIEGVPPGRRILRATRFDHNTFELEVLSPTAARWSWTSSSRSDRCSSPRSRTSSDGSR